MTRVTSSASYQRLVPPHITKWSAESDLQPKVVVRNDRISYMYESPGDRDENDILWYRNRSLQGQGRPEFKVVHPQRQKEKMTRLRCQVCAGPADRTSDGVLWLLTPDYDDDWINWPENAAVEEPPVCRSCARRAMRQCPALRRRAALVRVRNCPIVGVRGAFYVPGWPFARPVDQVFMRFSDPAIGWVRASALLRELHGCTAVSADELDSPTAP
jgi:hypothetical protein